MSKPVLNFSKRCDQKLQSSLNVSLNGIGLGLVGPFRVIQQGIISDAIWNNNGLRGPICVAWVDKEDLASFLTKQFCFNSNDSTTIHFYIKFS